MKKSLFTKLISIYFFIILISYSLVAVFLSMWFYNYYYNQKADILLNEGANLNTTVINYLNKKVSISKLNYELSVVDRLLNSRVWLLDKYGYIYAHSEGEEGTIGNQLTSNEIQEVMNRNIVVKTGLFKDKFNKTMLSVGLPVVYNDQVVGSIFLHTPLDEVHNALKKIYFVIWMSAFFAIVISAFIIYYISDVILIKPLGKINETAKHISRGDFDRRVNLQSSDEIGDLAVSFNYMADSLENLENMRKSFVANISHELRSPMTSINGFIVGMLDGTIPDEKRSYYLEIVHDEIKRLIRMINDLLDLARLESGEFSFYMGVFDINELIRQRVIKFEDKISKKQINMDVILIDNKMNVVGDRDRIDQVITNLVDNAIKFVPEKGTVQIKTEIKEKRLLVSVFNSDTTIPKDEIKYVWDRFHKADKARSKGAGTGLGLSIARQIVNQHKQTIWVESGDRGTRFTFTLSLE